MGVSENETRPILMGIKIDQCGKPKFKPFITHEPTSVGDQILHHPSVDRRSILPTWLDGKTRGPPRPGRDHRGCPPIYTVA